MAMRRIALDDSLAGLIGFAKRARQLSTGAEGVQRYLKQKKLALVLVDESLSANSLERFENLAIKLKTPLFIIERGERSLYELTGNKVMGVVKGSMAQGIMQKLNQESS